MLPLGPLYFHLQSHLMRAVLHTRPHCFYRCSSLVYKSGKSSLSYCTRNWPSLYSVIKPSSVGFPCASSAHRTPSVACFRWKQTKAGEQSRLGNVDNKEYIELYFIKNISFLRVLCRFAKLSVIMFLFATPASFMSAQLGVIPVTTGTNIVSIFATYAVLFTCQSWLFSSRVIGKIMLSSDDKVVKVSHLSLFGERQDVFLKPSDFVAVKKERGEGFMAENLCQVRIKTYPKRLLYMPHQGHADTDHERIHLILSGQY